MDNPVKYPLKGVRCYLTWPIENDAADGWDKRKTVKDFLIRRFGIDVFDPFADPKQQWFPALLKARQEKDFATISRIATDFVHKDLKLVNRSDLLIACLPYKVATAGCHKEIDLSNYNKNPTIIICPEGAEYAPFWYYGYSGLRDTIFGSWDEVYDYLHQIEIGMHMENERWDFIRGII